MYSKGTSIQGGNLQSKKKLGDSLILQIADNKPYGVKSLSHHLEHNSLQPSHQILSKLSNIKVGLKINKVKCHSVSLSVLAKEN